MNERTVEPNGASKEHSKNVRLSDDLADLVLETCRHVIRGSLTTKERFKFMTSYFEILEKYIADKDIKNAMFTQALIDLAFFNFGLIKPGHWTAAMRRGGRADKTKKGIQLALTKVLPRIRKMSPYHAWRFFETNYPEDKQLSVGEYEIFCDGDSLIQEDRIGKSSSIKYKTFQKYFYQARKENP